MRNPDFVAYDNKGADQTAHPRSLIGAFVIRFIVIMTARLNECKTSKFKLVFVTIQAGLSVSVNPPKRGILVSMPKC